MSAIAIVSNLDHATFVVPDLDAAIWSYSDVLGGELAYETEWMSKVLGETRFAMLLLRLVTKVELVENRPPHGIAPGRGDIGSPHIVFFVDDIDAAVMFLKRSQAAVAEPIQRPCAYPVKGEAFVYSTARCVAWMKIVTFAGPRLYEAERWDDGMAARS